MPVRNMAPAYEDVRCEQWCKQLSCGAILCGESWHGVIPILLNAEQRIQNVSLLSVLVPASETQWRWKILLWIVLQNWADDEEKASPSQRWEWEAKKVKKSSYMGTTYYKRLFRWIWDSCDEKWCSTLCNVVTCSTYGKCGVMTDFLSTKVLQ